jgi:hypothetical protein
VLMAIPSGRGALGVMAALLLVAGSGAGLAQGPAAPTAAPGPASTPLDPAKLTAADFAQLPFVESPVISPDGTRFAGFFSMGGKQVIGIFNLFDQGEKRTLIGIPDGTETTFIRWVNEDNVLIGLQGLMNVGALVYLASAWYQPGDWQSYQAAVGFGRSECG